MLCAFAVDLGFRTAFDIVCRVAHEQLEPKEMRSKPVMFLGNFATGSNALFNANPSECIWDGIDVPSVPVEVISGTHAEVFVFGDDNRCIRHFHRDSFAMLPLPSHHQPQHFPKLGHGHSL